MRIEMQQMRKIIEETPGAEIRRFRSGLTPKEIQEIDQQISGHVSHNEELELIGKAEIDDLLT